MDCIDLRADGCGKSSTLAALIQENQPDGFPAHCDDRESDRVCLPAPARLHRSGSGADTPSLTSVAGRDAENPDVLMVGEMREPATIRLTLNARRPATWCSQTIHSASCVEALQRMVSAFSPRFKPAWPRILADCIVGWCAAAEISSGIEHVAAGMRNLDAQPTR